MAQVDQGGQNLLIGVDFAASAASGIAPAFGLGLLLREAAGDEFGQGCCQKLTEGRRFEAKEGANTIFGK